MKHNTSIVVAALVLAGFVGSASAADVVVIGHPAAAALTKDQVADTFLGKNPSLSVVDLPESSPIRADFYKQATGRDAAQVKAAWSRLVFSGKAQPPKEAADAAAVKKAVAADPKAVGYIEKSAVDGTVKVVSTLN
jgi:ABC-type phosphate transport system substrate-binding protein